MSKKYLDLNGKEMTWTAENGKVFGISALLVNGNEKIGKNIYHFSTLPGFVEFPLNNFNYVAKGTCFCNCSGCYGQSGNYKRYKSTYALLALRTMYAKENTKDFAKQIIKEIQSKKIKYVRIHATGDFFSKEYAAAWLEIISTCKDCIFWTYTKSFGYGFDDILNAINALPNANIVESVLPSCGFNFGHIDYILDSYYQLKAAGNNPYICRCGIDKNQHCNNCKGCSCHKYVLFIEHSTEYKAEKDPLYNDIKTLIDSQESQAY